jgi:hypothetical protein
VAGALLLASVPGLDPALAGQRSRTATGASGPAKAVLPDASAPRGVDVFRTARRGWSVVESGPVEFGEVIPGQGSVLPGAVRVRVFAAGPWRLKLVPQTPLRVVDHGGRLVPASRLRWRSADSGGFRPVAENREFVVARGRATGPVGTLVVVDLRMDLESSDELGRYGCSFRVELETL